MDESNVDGLVSKIFMRQQWKQNKDRVNFQHQGSSLKGVVKKKIFLNTFSSQLVLRDGCGE